MDLHLSNRTPVYALRGVAPAELPPKRYCSVLGPGSPLSGIAENGACRTPATLGGLTGALHGSAVTRWHIVQTLRAQPRNAGKVPPRTGAGYIQRPPSWP